MVYYDEVDTVKAIWEQMAEQLSQCEVCVHRFHEAFVYCEEEFDEESSAQLLAILKRLNAERVAKSFRMVSTNVGVIPAGASNIFTLCHYRADVVISCTGIGRTGYDEGVGRGSPGMCFLRGEHGLSFIVIQVGQKAVSVHTLLPPRCYHSNPNCSLHVAKSKEQSS